MEAIILVIILRKVSYLTNFLIYAIIVIEKERINFIMSSDTHLFKLARECSFKSDYTGCGRARIGCIVVYKGTVLAKGFNSDRTHTVQAKYNTWRYHNSGNRYLPEKIHGEISALNKIKYLDIDFSKVHVYVYRELRNGTPAMARPCPACMAAIHEMGIKYIHYTTEHGIAVERIEK